jgi:hypothetical protein
MRWSIANFLSDAFPDLGHPRYQSTLEKLSFVLVTSSLVGILITSLALVLYEL